MNQIYTVKMFIVTGANGFIGSAMTRELNQNNLPVLACVDTISLGLRPGLLQNKKFENFLLKDELWDFLNLPSTQEKVTWVIHMGANSSTTETNAEHLWENNTHYTQKIFEWCTKYKKNLIYASSAATYGAGEMGYDDLTDSEKLHPLNLYGESKVNFDRWAVKQDKTPPQWYGLRFFNVFGPNEYFKESMASLVFKAHHQIQNTGKMQLFKSYLSEYKHGEQMRDFIYVKDVTRWMMELTYKKAASGIYNMGFGKARTWVDLAKAVFMANNIQSNIEFVDMPGSIKNQYQYFTQAKMDKWFSAGLSQPQWSLEAAIDDYVKNYLSKSNLVL
jgi:ADP-L-glycero-D-manno-heptose 6-epimerase